MVIILLKQNVAMGVRKILQGKMTNASHLPRNAPVETVIIAAIKIWIKMRILYINVQMEIMIK